MRLIDGYIAFSLSLFVLWGQGCTTAPEPPAPPVFQIPSWAAFQGAMQAQECRDHSVLRRARGQWIASWRIQSLSMTPRTVQMTGVVLQRGFPASELVRSVFEPRCEELVESVEAHTLAVVRAWQCLAMEPLQDGARRELIQKRLGRGLIDWAHVDAVRTNQAEQPLWLAALKESTGPCPALDVAVLESASAMESPARVGRLFGDRRATLFIAGGSGAPLRGELHLGNERLGLEIVPLADGVLRGQAGDAETGFRFEAHAMGKGRFNGTWSLGPVGSRERGTLVLAPQPVALHSTVDK